VKKLFATLVIIVIVLAVVTGYRAATVFEDRQIEPAAAYTPIGIDEDDAVQRFSQALTFQTVSHDDRSRFVRAEGPTHLAGLFAAKEAVMKALGTGMAGANFSDIRVRHFDSGQPYIELEGKARSKADELGVRTWHVSITHSKTTAAAVAIATSDD